MCYGFRISALLAVFCIPGCRQADQDSVGGPSVPEWPVDLVARIGSVDDPDLGLTRVTEVVFGPDGNVYIAQSSEREVRVYDLEGNLLQRIGREGEGPGEFRAISAIGFITDTLFVVDPTLRRFNLLEPNGRFISSLSWVSVADEVPRPPVFYIPTGPQVVRGDGSAFVQQGFGFMPGETDEIPVPWLRIWRDSSRQDTIAIQKYDLGMVQTLSEQGRDFMISPPINGAPLFRLMADGSGLVVVERPIADGPTGNTFRVVKIGAGGDTIVVTEHPYIPVPVPTDEADRQISLELERYSSGRPAPSREGLAKIYRQEGFIPQYYPPVTSIRTGQAGRIWAEREPADPNERIWTAISPSGEMEGQIRLPEGTRIMAANRDLLAALQLDEFDVPYVLVYRIRPE